MKKRDKVLREARSRLQSGFGDKIKDVILFGSRAWGRPKPWSDWDFVVVVRGDYDRQVVRGIRDVMAYLDLDLDVFTQTLVISEEELQHSLRGKQPLFIDATQHGIYA